MGKNTIICGEKSSENCLKKADTQYESENTHKKTPTVVGVFLFFSEKNQPFICLATSAAKSSSFFSIPSPKPKRT